MTGRIFISYRRADSQYATDRIYEKLAAQFGADSVFMDIDDIPLGVNFREYIDQQVSTSDIVLAVIGDHWLTAADADGNLRLQNPGDFVRLEIEAALCQGIKLIPVFIGDVHSLPVSHLPESMKDLPMLNATRIRRGTDFLPDVDRLIRGIIRINEEQAAKREANKAALASLKQSAAEIKSQLSSFEAVMIQEMRTRTQLEDEVRRLEELVLEHLSDPAKQLRVDVRSYRQQIEKLGERLLELSLQIEARKQGRIIEVPVTAEENPQPVAIPEPEPQPAPKKAVKPEPVRQPKPKTRTAEKIDFGQLLHKVPIWAWGGLAVVLLAAVFGPMLLKGISGLSATSAPEGTITAVAADTSPSFAPTPIPDGVVEYLDWMNAVTETSPDFLEDFSVDQPYWVKSFVSFYDEREETNRDVMIADLVTDGALNIIDEPVTNTHYGLHLDTGYFINFILQFDLSLRQFQYGSNFDLNFREGGSGGYRFYLKADGEWSLSKYSPSEEEELASGQLSALVEGSTYEVQVFAWGDMMAVQWQGKLLAYFEDDSFLEGGTNLATRSYKPIDVTIDNIEIWDLSGVDYLAELAVEFSQAQAFYQPIREYLANNVPTFQEDFETYQPYWEEMQVNFNDNKPVELAALVQDEGHIWLNSAEELEYDLFQLNFPQLSAQTFAIQYDFAFYDLESTIVFTLMDAFWGPEENREWFNTYCDFYLDRQEIWCGLNQGSESDNIVEIFNHNRPFYKDITETYTLLTIFYQDQTAIFLDGYFMGYADGLEQFDQQISIRFGRGNAEDEFGVRVDNIKFWDLDYLDYKLSAPAAFVPVIDYLSSTSPTFEEDFDVPQSYWDQTPVLLGEGDFKMISEFAGNGNLTLVHGEVSASEGFNIKFPQMHAANFAVQYDYHWSDPGSAYYFHNGLYFDDPESGRLKYSSYCDFQDGSNCGFVTFDDSGGRRDVFGREQDAYKEIEAPSTILAVFFQGQYAMFLDGYFVGSASDLEHRDLEMDIYLGTNPGEAFSVELDNIKFWNLDDADIQLSSTTGQPSTDPDMIQQSLSSTQPDFQEDFATPDESWAASTVYMPNNSSPMEEFRQSNYLVLDSTGYEGAGPDTFQFLLPLPIPLPELQVQEFAVQFVFDLRNPGAEGSIISIGIETAVDPGDESLGGYDARCEFTTGLSSIWCGVNPWFPDQSLEGQGLEFNPSEKNIYSPYTMLLVFYQGTFYGFLNENNVVQVENIENGYAFVRLKVACDQNPENLAVALDNLKFWVLDGVEIDQ